MKNVTIDFRMHLSSGIGTYLRNIVPFLAQSDSLKVNIIAYKDELTDYPWIKNVRIIPAHSTIYSIKEQIELPKIIPECDIFWSPHYNVPIFRIRAKRRVVTIHDVFHLEFFKTLTLKQKLYARVMFNIAAKKSDLIFTVSEFSKSEIQKHISTQKPIKVVYNGVNTSIFKKIEDQSVLQAIKTKYSLPENFILYVGNVKPHKNLKTLLFAIKDFNVNLVIVGKREGFITPDNEIMHLIDTLNLKDRVFFTGFVSEKDIPFLYNLALFLVFPSIYEGFGLPLIEAQACMTPVIASKIPALQEIGRDSVLYFEPKNSEELKGKIQKLLKDKYLREKLIRKGYSNAKRFSWKKAAIEITELFLKL